MHYDHTVHAGNAGDVWKHFILTEAARCLMARRKQLNYVESHVGYPDYLLGQDGEWEGGIGRCWKRLDALLDFSYFKIIVGMNSTGLKKYPGSASIVMEVAKIAGSTLQSDIWDIDLGVADAWYDMPNINPNLRFHLGDGFAGARSLMDRNRCTLLLIDPPYLDKRDAFEAVDLFERAERSGWTVLWWQMMDAGNMRNLDDRIMQYSLEFVEAGLYCEKWKGANIALAGDDDLQSYVNRQSEKFLEIMQSLAPTN
jgi:23S rRNA (adenine2030-N6)-methyltransferase